MPQAFHKRQEVVGPLKEALEQAKKTAGEAQVEVSDLCKSTRRRLSGWSSKAGSP